MPEVLQSLTDYAAIYERAYGTETIAELIPAMLAAFVESDRSFAKSRARTS